MFDVNSVSQAKTESGVWTEFSGGEFLIAHTSNLSFQREFNRLQQPYRKQLDKGKLDPKTSSDILCKAMARGLLLDWKNVGAEGANLEYSPDAASNVLKNNEDLRDFVQEFSLDLDNFRSEEQADSGKS